MKRSRQNCTDISHRVIRNTLVIDLEAVYRILSSAPRGGGLVRARSILNHQVRANPRVPRHIRSMPVHLPRTWSDPARYLGKLAVQLKAAAPSVGLMTAVPLKQLVRAREAVDGIWVACFCTVGVTNAVRAGEPAHYSGEGRGCERTGTINIILVTNAMLSRSAMVGAVQVATESKTATLLEHRVRSAGGRHMATGTGTDAVVIASRLRGGRKIMYSGTHTILGSIVGRLVAHCVGEGLRRSARWRNGSSRSGDRARASSTN